MKFQVPNPKFQAAGARMLLLGIVSLLGTCNWAVGALLEIQITPRISGALIQPESLRYRTSAGETFSVTRVSGLLSGFALQRADGSWLEIANSVAWFDLEKARLSHCIASVPAGEYRAVRFFIGPDEKLNHADVAQFPAEHPLNPNLNNLHWSWQGGFIFLALEGMWRNAAGEFDGWAYHLARDTNRTAVTLAATITLASDTRLDLDLDLGALLNAPRPLSFAKDGSSTHSRDNDPIAAALVANLPGAFAVRRTRILDAKESAVKSPKPLYFPAQFTPYSFRMGTAFPIPDLPKDNPLIAERVALGARLFNEKEFSKDNTISCASCHDQRNAFADSRQYSRGVRGQAGFRNSMPLFNLAWKSSFFWDGRAASLREQALMPIQDHLEMDESLTSVVAKLEASSNRREEAPSEVSDAEVSLHASAATRGDYPALFAAAFGSPEVTPEKIGLALESFLLTLTSFDSRFDRALAGQAQLSDEERRGMELFMTEYDPRRGQFGADCFHCHGGPLFQSQTFANNGLDAKFTDLGRGKITGKESDAGKFSTPSLRNAALTAPYMHDGRFATLEEVVEHYSTGQKRSATLDPNLAKHPDGGVQLSAEDKRALVAFLKTLTDEKFLSGQKR